MKAVRVRATIERKDSSLPRFVAVPASRLTKWDLQGTTPVEVAIDGIAVGRRNLKRWGRERDCWFIDLTQRICRRVNVDTGSRIRLDLTPVPGDLPIKLSELLAARPAARRAWEARTAGQQRMLAEYIRAAKRPATQTRRAVKALS